jgi:hypothetical protein
MFDQIKVLVQLQNNYSTLSILNTLSPALSIKMLELFPIRAQPIPLLITHMSHVSL